MTNQTLPPRISFLECSQLFRVWCGGRSAIQIYFSIAQYGSKEKALKAAMAYEKKLPARCREGKNKHRKTPTTRSQTGVVGVCPFLSKKGAEAGYRAFWSEDKKVGGRVHKSKDFPYSIFGSNAFVEAKKYRRLKVMKNQP